MRISVQCDDCEIAAYPDEFAGSDAPWLVLSNSLGCDQRMWEGQLPALRRHYRVLRYDTRGHGSSSATEGEYTLDGLSKDVVALLDHFEIDTATFVGLSLGGMTGLHLALNYPDRISKLVCCDARSDWTADGIAGWDDRVRAVEEGGIAAILPGTIERWLMPETRKNRPDVVKLACNMILETSDSGYVGCARAIQTMELFKRLHGLKVRTDYLVGEFDAGAPPEAMQAMADATPGGRLRTVAKAAHIANLDNPASFNEALADLLEVRPGSMV